MEAAGKSQEARLKTVEASLKNLEEAFTVLTAGVAGLTLRYGFVQTVTNAGGSVEVKYSKEFATGTSAVVAVAFENAGVSEATIVEVQNVTKAGFVGFYNAAGKKVGIMYIAIGF